MGGLFDCSTVAGLRLVVYGLWSTASRVALEVFTERSRLSSNKVKNIFLWFSSTLFNICQRMLQIIRMLQMLMDRWRV